MKNAILIVALLFKVSLFAQAQGTPKTPALKLWYKQPANALMPDTMGTWRDDPEWVKALPLGNGSLGAMVFGDVAHERIQLNEKTLWSGSHADSDNPAAHKSLDSIRQLLFQGKYTEATNLTNRTQICKGPGSGMANGANIPYGTYQTLGDLRLDFVATQPYRNYYRELSLDEAIARVSYEQSNIQFQREMFVSYPANALVIRLTANRKGSISFTS